MGLRGDGMERWDSYTCEPWGLQSQVGLSWLKGTLHGKE